MEKAIKQAVEKAKEQESTQRFQQLIQKPQYIGELFSINYENAIVQIHDYQRQKVGGIPGLSFLLATRIDPDDSDIDFKDEDTSCILLRVMDAAQLPGSTDIERIKSETAQRVSGDTQKHWDVEGIMDTKTRSYLGYAGILCRIIGTFFLDISHEGNENGNLDLKFGSDLSNFYPNRGLKVYKPNSDALKTHC